MQSAFVVPLQAGGPPGGVVELVRHASPVAIGVLLVLAGFSVVSWAIILDRALLLRKANRESDRFLETFRNSARFSQVRRACDRLRTTPLSGLFLAGYAELASQMGGGEGNNPHAGGRPPVQLSLLERALQRAARGERRRLGRMMMFLATTGAVTPFVGLFGTVWGIMNAFRSIGAYGTANLAVVAPGISEALVTTAAGLAAAIPAVIAYNHLLGGVRRLTARMEDFSLEFLNVVERNFTTRR